jgi:hypothetical protein
MKRTILSLFSLFLASITAYGQATISCPGVDAGNDTSCSKLHQWLCAIDGSSSFRIPANHVQRAANSLQSLPF